MSLPCQICDTRHNTTTTFDEQEGKFETICSTCRTESSDAYGDMFVDEIDVYGNTPDVIENEPD